MNNFFGNFLKKIIPKKENNERSRKEEEDIISDIQLNFQIQSLPVDTLNKIVSGQIINGMIIETYIFFHLAMTIM
jgi:hypothetical protein